MGFLKRFFSLGSRKSTKRKEPRTAQAATPRRSGRSEEPWQHEQEGDVTRLLRSSSTHFNVVKEVDYTTLPPLPHPINSVATTLATPTQPPSSMQRRGTYTVKVLERKLESRTELPHANPLLQDDKPSKAKREPRGSSDEGDDAPHARIDPRTVPITPRDQSRLVRLRQDPSVASLLNMYDSNGCISNNAFSNSPNTPHNSEPIIGREPVKRSGSTLRQLLGDTDNAEGDISWAERFLGEHANSSQCSLASTAPVETPKDFQYVDDLSNNKKSIVDASIAVLSDGSVDASASLPVISSMEVEVSGSTEHHFGPGAGATSIRIAEPRTPLRASEVFGFLTERRKTVLERQKSLRAMEATTATSLAPASLNATASDTARLSTSNGSPDTSDTSIMAPAQIRTATVAKLTPVLIPSLPSTSSTSAPTSAKSLYPPTHIPIPSTKAQLTGDSQVSLASGSASSSKIPRGPRPLLVVSTAPSAMSRHLRRPSAGPEVYRDTHDETRSHEVDSSIGRSNAVNTRIPILAADPFTPVRHSQQRRVISHASSVASNDRDSERRAGSHQHKRSRKSERAHTVDKENTPPSAPVSAVPLRTIFDKRHPNMAKDVPPSPASSSDLSPVTRDMMASLRKQRNRARDASMRSSVGRSSRRRP